jgi:hypothetical protein
MEIKKISEEQKKEFKKLMRSFHIKTTVLTFKWALTLFVTNLLVVMINRLYVHNESFVFTGYVLNFLFTFRSHRSKMEKEHDRVKVEVKKILEK